MAIEFDEEEGDEAHAAPSMNTTPLIDVLLVLLVMLIITIPIQLHSVRMDLPGGAPPPDAPDGGRSAPSPPRACRAGSTT